MLLTGKGILPLYFFWKSVADVIDSNAMSDEIIPMIGNVTPTSTPKTITDPIKPKITPNHCFQPTYSLRKVPASAFVKIGCMVTIKAVIPVGMSLDTEKKTPPK